MRFNTYYMDDALFNLEKVIERAKKDLTDVDFDTLVGTGFSGGVVIPSLALAMGKEFALIRKDTDDSHHGKGRLLGSLGKRWIFVDDFVSSGKTRKRVIKKVNDVLEGHHRDGGVFTSGLIGQYMYINYSENGPQFEHYSSEWLDTSW